MGRKQVAREDPNLLGHDVLVMLSGGLDSAVLAYYFSAQLRANPLGLHLKGLNNAPAELAAARTLARGLRMPLAVVDVSYIISACSRSERFQGERLPFGLFMALSIAISYAASHDIPLVAIGLHYEDGEASVQTRPAALALTKTALELTETRCQVIAPFLHWSKEAVLSKGHELSVPFQLTWSCVRPVAGHQDGECVECRMRRAAFLHAGIADPTVYYMRSEHVATPLGE